MAFPMKITDTPVNTDILYNNKWKLTDLYFQNTDGGYNCSYINTLNKQVTENANEALIYLLQRSIKEGEGWNEQKMAEFTPEEFSNLVIDWGYLASPTGENISTGEFWQYYMAINNGMREEKSYSLAKNGIAITEIDPEFLEERNIISVTSFVNGWNWMQIFFETYSHWVFFTWVAAE